MSDKDNIEKFFEERLSRKHFVFRESDWEKMEEKLDAELMSKPASAFTRRNSLLIFAALLLAFLSGWYGSKLFTPENSQTTASSPDVSTTSEIDNDAGNTPEVSGDIENDDTPSADTHREQKTVRSGDEAAKTRKLSAGHTKIKENNLVKFVPQKHGPSEVPAESISSLPADFIEGEKGAFLPLKKSQMDHEMSLTGMEVDSLSNRQVKQKAYKFAIGLTYAPDLTSTGFFNRQQLAQSFGVQFVYKINRKWGLQTGISYVKKKYEADPENYEPYENYWQYKTNGYIPDEVYGNCGVIDIPVNITFNWSGAGRFSFVTTAGISSYFLLDEEYYYEFDNYPNASYGWSTTENSRFIGGIINASFGVSVKVNKRTSLLMEPYLKIPVQNVGYGNLKLFSTGSFFTIRYDIL